jgi:hypothetical protein
VITNSIGGHKAIAILPTTGPIAVIAALIAVAVPNAFLPRLVFTIDEVAIAEVARSASEIASAGSVAATLAITAETLRPSAVAFTARLVKSGSEILPARVGCRAASTKLAADIAIPAIAVTVDVKSAGYVRAFPVIPITAEGAAVSKVTACLGLSLRAVPPHLQEVANLFLGGSSSLVRLSSLIR